MLLVCDGHARRLQALPTQHEFRVVERCEKRCGLFEAKIVLRRLRDGGLNQLTLFEGMLRALRVAKRKWNFARIPLSAILFVYLQWLQKHKQGQKIGLTAKKWSVLQLPNVIAFCRRALVGEGHVGPPQALQIQHEFCVVGCFEKCCDAAKGKFHFCDDSVKLTSPVAFSRRALVGGNHAWPLQALPIKHKFGVVRGCDKVVVRLSKITIFGKISRHSQRSSHLVAVLWCVTATRGVCKHYQRNTNFALSNVVKNAVAWLKEKLFLRRFRDGGLNQLTRGLGFRV